MLLRSFYLLLTIAISSCSTSKGLDYTERTIFDEQTVPFTNVTAFKESTIDNSHSWLVNSESVDPIVRCGVYVPDRIQNGQFIRGAEQCVVLVKEGVAVTQNVKVPRTEKRNEP